MRTKIINWIIAFIFLSLALGAFNLTVVQGPTLKRLSDKNSIRLLPQEGSRGRILDRSGRIIAGSHLSYDVVVSPLRGEELDDLLTGVSRVLGRSPKDLKEAFRKGFISYSLPVVVARDVDLKTAITFEELKLDLPGVIIQPRPMRDYPFGRLACHLLGYLNEIDHWRLTKLADYGYKTKDTVGFGGVEEKYDYYLRQEEGGLLVEVDHQGKFVRVLGFKPPKDGKDLQLTLDLDIQKVAEDSFLGQKGSVIIMDPYTGEIIAMVSGPNFDPRVFIKKTNSSALNNLFKDSEAPLINRAISASFPPASVFKLIVASAALETAKINSGTSFFCQGGMNIGNRRFSCWDTHGNEDLVSAIAHSCNVFFYRTGLLLGAENIHDYSVKFGLSKPTSIELPYEVSGFLPHPLWRKFYGFSRQGGIPLFAGKNWFDGDTANFSIGQGEVLVTPLQVARMMAVFANKGFLVSPHIVKAISAEEISGNQKKSTRVPVKESTLNYIMEGLIKAVSGQTGTANVLSGLSISVSGKTGTAQVTHGQSHGWFTGFFPAKGPKFVICVFLENGGSGSAACLLARQIIEGMAQQGLVSQ